MPIDFEFAGSTVLDLFSRIHSLTGSAYVRAFLLLALLSACTATPTPPLTHTLSVSQARELIDSSLPHPLSDREGWINDIYAGFTVQSIDLTHENVCAVVAVIEQESNFRVDPIVPGLARIAWREIDSRAAHAGVPRLLVHGALSLTSSNGRTYAERIDAAKTEKDLSDIFEDFIGAVPMGQSLFADRDPIRTRGPMQVNVTFAKEYASARPYPYPVTISIPDEVFSRRGSLYFGIGHLLAYTAPYDEYLFRFADFNSGQYASRNAAFQSALARASGIAVTADGALLPHETDAKARGETEMAARALGRRLNLDDEVIHDALSQAKSLRFQTTSLYQRVFAMADQTERRALPRAVVPRIVLRGPKLTRDLSTDWYAHHVNDRFLRCLRR